MPKIRQSVRSCTADELSRLFLECMLACSLAFFLFGFQGTEPPNSVKRVFIHAHCALILPLLLVHEKSILLPLMPACLLMMRDKWYQPDSAFKYYINNGAILRAQFKYYFNNIENHECGRICKRISSETTVFLCFQLRASLFADLILSWMCRCLLLNAWFGTVATLRCSRVHVSSTHIKSGIKIFYIANFYVTNVSVYPLLQKDGQSLQ